MTGRPRTGLRTRLVAFCVAIAAASIGTTAWTAARSASSAIQQEYTADVAAAADVYDQLSGYAATHPDWSGAGTLVGELARRTGDRVTLTGPDGDIVQDSAGRSSLPADARPAATIDPLDPPAPLGQDEVLGGIDVRAVGPFALPDAELQALRQQFDRVAQCYLDVTSTRLAAVTQPNGRPAIPDSADFTTGCFTGTGLLDLLEVTPGERAAAEALLPAVTGCFGTRAVTLGDSSLSIMTGAESTVGTVYVGAGDPWFLSRLVQAADASGPQVQQCVRQARAAQLTGYVAPRVQLYLSGATGQAVPGLSVDGARRVALGGVVVLVVTVALCLAAATGLRRPLAELTAAVQATARGKRGAPVPRRGTREMVSLAEAVTDLSAQLSAAEQRRQDMISDVAHELRTPLSNIRGWLEAVEDRVVTLDPALVGSLLEEAVLLQQLVDELQDLALADAGQLTVHPELVDVGELAEQVVAAHGAAARAKGLALSTAVRGDVVAPADPGRLRQVLGNLVSNAVRYTDAGSVRVTVRRAGAQVAVQVTDTGVGIAAEDLPHLFERFWRAEKSRSRAGGGSGLGLAITRHLVEAHGGRIEVTSTPGAGTTVTVHLPAGGV